MGVFEYTNKGGREQNQDYLTYKNGPDKVSVYVVADGMGGYVAGDIAAKLVGDSVVEFVGAHYSELNPEQEDIHGLYANTRPLCRRDLNLYRVWCLGERSKPCCILKEDCICLKCVQGSF